MAVVVSAAGAINTIRVRAMINLFQGQAYRQAAKEWAMNDCTGP